MRNAMANADAENLLSALSPRVDAFGTCVIGKNHALRVGPAEEIIVHYVLSGEGSLGWGDQRRHLVPGTVIIVPKAFAKTIAGRGATRTITDASETCVVAEGIVRFETPGPSDDQLILACANVSERSGSGLGLFDCLREPLIEPRHTDLTWAFEGILRELSNPMIGCKAIIESFMKQILLFTLRTAISKAQIQSALFMTVEDPQLARVINAIISQPAERHTTDDLAQKSGMSSAALSEKFQRVFGQSPSEYVHHVRLGASIPMLLETNLPVKTIAAAVGFSSRSHFSRSFSKANGTDPSSYRLAERSSVALG